MEYFKCHSIVKEFVHIKLDRDENKVDKFSFNLEMENIISWKCTLKLNDLADWWEMQTKCAVYILYTSQKELVKLEL